METTHSRYCANEDGQPHFAYYDQPLTLSFVWDGSWEHPIQVCHGGYGEPPIDEIWPEIPRASLMTTAPSWWLTWFKVQCRQYIAERKDR